MKGMLMLNAQLTGTPKLSHHISESIFVKYTDTVSDFYVVCLKGKTFFML